MWSSTIDRVRPRILFRWLLLAGWPVHLVFGASATVTLLLAIASGQPAIADATIFMTAQYALGLCTSFAVHELGHLAVLSRTRGVGGLTLERSMWRISVRPNGGLRGRDAALAAVSGPGCCVVVGVVLWLVAADLSLHGWYLAHAIFLTPVFGDGRALLAGLRWWNRRLPARGVGDGSV